MKTLILLDMSKMSKGQKKSFDKLLDSDEKFGKHILKRDSDKVLIRDTLFDYLQSKIESFKSINVALIGQKGKKLVKIIEPNKILSDRYMHLLRVLRLGEKPIPLES